jgi:hypothetical protein
VMIEKRFQPIGLYKELHGIHINENISQ